MLIPTIFAAVKTYSETAMSKTGYYERQVPTYLEQWERRDEVVAQVAALEREALRSRIPVPHRYEIQPER